MMPQLALLVQPSNARIRDDMYANVLIPVFDVQDAHLTYVGALMALAMTSNQLWQFRLSRVVWRFLRQAEIDVANIYELDHAMREVITSVRQAKTAEDISHFEQFFVVSDWNGNDVILASDRPVTLANRDEFCRRREQLRIGQLTPSLA
jgi:hypothetical protein